MKCKRCGSSLIGTGYVCSKCGMMMDSEQVKIQKDLIKSNSQMAVRPEFVSERYGGKKQLFESREEKNGTSILLLLFLLLFLLIFIVVVYFFLNRGK